MKTITNTTIPFQMECEFEPQGDQPQAIAALVNGIVKGRHNQVLLGVTGSGKTFTMAKVIETLDRPALILAHNKTLAGQLYSEMRSFFPKNAVEYFVSYYDYYQPEAYVPRTDTYIEKDSAINEQIDRMRHSATQAILTRRDVVIVASVSCIYGIGSPEAYQEMSLHLITGNEINQRDLLKKLVEIQFQRNDIDFQRGRFRVRGDTIEIFPPHEEERAVRIEMFGDTIDRMASIDPLTGRVSGEIRHLILFPASHYATQRTTVLRAVEEIKRDLTDRLAWFHSHNRALEAQRLESRTLYDLEMIQEVGYCSGIENYSRYLSGRAPGEPPPTLLEYLPKDALLFVDESHVTLPQVRGMFKGDRSRKETLVEHGFRLPSALDNRPLTFEEFDRMRPVTVHVSATPALLEMEKSAGAVVEQIVRPTGLLEPECTIRPVEGQVDGLLEEIRLTTRAGQRVLVTTLTKKMAEDLTDYLQDLGVRVRYLHSDIDTLERLETIRDLRQGEFDVLVGINLLREGLDIPEVGLVAILDADKEGFLRSTTSLIQTIGRAARNVQGRVVLYADRITGSMQRALDETDRRRRLQVAFNKKHAITPRSISKGIMVLPGYEQRETPVGTQKGRNDEEESITLLRVAEEGSGYRQHRNDLRLLIRETKKKMQAAAKEMEFELAARYRDQLLELERQELFASGGNGLGVES
ncbi:MAG TPA: excinuclease ABC subunit B [Alphaproteobacteria bacterium]|nr:excinuclease ABC subunit B [Alphaproteobacteria bacterium]